MWQRLFFGFLLAIAAYYVVQYFSNESFINSMEGNAGVIHEQKSRGSMQVSSGGPNSPNSAPPDAISRPSPPPEANDPYDPINEDADAPERLRYPERSFSPGIIPQQTEINENAGLAGPVGDSPQAFQQFNPEFVTNGGAFFGTVNANEDENPNYSAF